MKFFTKFFLTLLLFTSFVNSQQLIEMSMGSAYEYDIYFSLEDGITAFPERENWELAFSTNSNDNNIRINSAYVKLYQVSENIDDWEEITNFNSSFSLQIRNSNTEWEFGAFVSNYFNKNPYNFGWGNLNNQTQIIEGCRIYIIEYFNELKKIKINNFNNGIFDFTISNLDGSSEENITIEANLYSNKKFIYYSLINNEIIDREPNVEDWDMVFTRYEEEYVILNGDTMPYVVTGVMTNQNLVAEFNGDINIYPNSDDLNFSYDINTIGYDWKEYSGEFIIVANRTYYILNQEQTTLYKILFQSFSGQASGNLSFTIEEINNFNPINSLSELENNFTISPNPNQGEFKINSNINDGIITIIDTRGKILIKEELSQSLTLNLNEIIDGIYLININGDKFNISKKMVIKK